jgi:hypothetical protein
MGDAPLTQPTSRGGNHPLWIMGHLAFVEGTLLQTIFGEPNPVEAWAPLFAPGTRPTADAAAYPPFAEVVATFHRLRKETIRRVEELGDEGLARAPKSIPPGFEVAMKTAGHTFLLIALHQMVHYGQIADARRVAGKAPLM